METPNIVKLLKTKLYDRLIHIAYIEEKSKLYEEFQDVDDDLMISHVKAYIIKAYEDKDDDFYGQENFTDNLKNCASGDVTILHELIYEFIKNINSLKAKIGDPVNKQAIENLKELEKYKDTEIYKELTKNNNTIARIIKEYYSYKTIKEIKDNCNDGKEHEGYVFSKDEIRIIEATKNFPQPNLIAHLIYDYINWYEYQCDHKINSDKDTLKKLYVNTNVDSPPHNIIFEDGTIVYYNEGDIRVRPYKFKHILRYTKLYAAKNFECVKSLYNDPTLRLDTPKKKGKQMIIDAFLHTIVSLKEYEEIYTQRIINDSKDNLAKIKELTKKYDL